jgi:hypothetical protein
VLWEVDKPLTSSGTMCLLNKNRKPIPIINNIVRKIFSYFSNLKFSLIDKFFLTKGGISAIKNNKRAINTVPFASPKNRDRTNIKLTKNICPRKRLINPVSNLEKSILNLLRKDLKAMVGITKNNNGVINRRKLDIYL